MKNKSKIRKKLIAFATASVLTVTAGIIPNITVSAEYTGLVYDDYLYYYKMDKDKDEVYDYAVITDCNEEAVSIEIPSEINGLPVTRIGKSAFSLCRKLTSVSIPDTVTVIENNAFSSTGLTEINLPDNLEEIGNYAFSNSKFETVSIPDTVKIINDGAFALCYSLNNVELGKSVEFIGGSAFTDCKSLSEITIPDSVKSVGMKAFDNTPLIDNQSGVKYADTWVVDCDQNFASVEIKDGTKGIAQYAFMEYDVLEEVTLPDSLEVIDENAFRACSNIKNMSTGDGVKTICKGAFIDCTGLKSFVMGNSVETVGDYVFQNCTKLEEITIPTSVKSIIGRAFWDTPWLAAKREENPFVVVNSILIDGITVPFTDDLTIPENVTTIGSYAFQTTSNEDKSINVTLPEYVTKIEHGGFEDFFVLQDIIIKNPDCEIIDNGYYFELVPDKYGVPAFEPDYGGTICYHSRDGEFFYDGTIIGHENSTAQAYAEKCGYNFEVLDDTPATTEPAVTTTTTTVTTITTETNVSKTTAETDNTISSTDISESTITTATTITTVTTTTATGNATEIILIGDANGDGNVNVRDCAFIAKALAKSEEDTLPENADYNDDGKINVRDAAALAKALASSSK